MKLSEYRFKIEFEAIAKVEGIEEIGA